MTEAEIVKILECCSKKVSESCAECPLRETNCLDISIEQLALALITDKNDSIEMYRRNIALLDEQILAKDKEIADMHRDVKSAEEYAWQMKTEKENLIKTYKECQAEAIKEFAERVEKHFREDICTYEVVINGQSYQAFLVDHTFREIRNAPNLFAKEMGVEL